MKPTSHSPEGIVFVSEVPHFTKMQEFRDGLFEGKDWRLISKSIIVQDEGAQLISQMVKAKPGQSVLDFCSGAGGKSLAIAPHLQGTGMKNNLMNTIRCYLPA